MLDIRELQGIKVLAELPAADPNEKLDSWVYLLVIDTDIPYIFDEITHKKVYPYYVGKSHSIEKRIKSHMAAMETPFIARNTKLYHYCHRFMPDNFDYKRVHFYILAQGKMTRDELIDTEAQFIIQTRAAKQGMNTADPEEDNGY